MVPREDIAGLPAAERLSGEWRPSVSAGEYQRAIEHIKHYIAPGKPIRWIHLSPADASGDPLAPLRVVRRAQRTRYGAYVEAGNHVIGSASPDCSLASTAIA